MTNSSKRVRQEGSASQAGAATKATAASHTADADAAAAAPLAPSAKKAREMIQLLSPDASHRFLLKLLNTSEAARSELCREVEVLRNAPVDLKYFRAKMNLALAHRCESKARRAVDIVVKECERLRGMSCVHSFQALTDVAGMVIGADDWLVKALLQYDDTVMDNIAAAMCEALEEASPKERGELAGDVKEVQSMYKAREAFGEEALECVQRKYADLGTAGSREEAV